MHKTSELKVGGFFMFFSTWPNQTNISQKKKKITWSVAFGQNLHPSCPAFCVRAVAFQSGKLHKAENVL